MSQPTEPALIEVKLNEIHQLFNSIDPSPFHERDLDHDAEQFIVGWAKEYPRNAHLKLIVHLAQPAEELAEAQSIITESIRHYFEYRVDMIRRDRRMLLREGRMVLLIGLAFLAVCELAAQGLPQTTDTWHAMLREGLTIIGWVAMWRPLEIFLYRWWPLRQLERVYCNLSAMTVEVRMGK